MADDSTTTGADANNVQGRKVRLVFGSGPPPPGAVIINGSGPVPLPPGPVQVDINLQDVPVLSVRFPQTLELHGDDTNKEVFVLHLIRRHSETEWYPVGLYAASWPLLETQEKMNAWLDRTLKNFARELSGVVFNNAALLLHASSALAMAETGLAPFTKRGVLRDYLAELEKHLRERFGIEQGAAPPVDSPGVVGGDT